MAERRRLDDMSAEIDEAAARWHLAQTDDDMDWTAFTDWLEADPRHREAFDAVALLDERIDAVRPILSGILAEPVRSRVRSVPRAGAWGAVAAVLIAVVLVLLYRVERPSEPVFIAYATGPGQIRTIDLAGGSHAILGPGSRLRVPASRDRPLVLEGKAFFEVRHDADHPLTVLAGGYAIRDVGTRFDVASGDGMVRVAVAEGEVAVGAADRKGSVAVVAGRALTLRDGGADAQLQPVPVNSVGGWRSGPLVYEQVPLGLVVADIARSSGQAVTIAPPLADRRFSGMIAQGDGRAMAGSLAALSGLTVGMDGDAIRLVDRAGR